MSTKLSKYFTLEELTVSQEAIRKKIDNQPTGQALINLTDTAFRMDAVRLLLGVPVIVSSGYRSPIVNSAIGGAKTSSHVSGLAVDFTAPKAGNNKLVFDRIRHSGIKFDQLILEFPDSPNGWIHIGFGLRGRGQCLKYDGKTYTEIAK